MESNLQLPVRPYERDFYQEAALQAMEGFINQGAYRESGGAAPYDISEHAFEMAEAMLLEFRHRLGDN